MPSPHALGKALVRDLKRGGIKTVRGDWLTRGAAGGVYRDAAGRVTIGIARKSGTPAISTLFHEAGHLRSRVPAAKGNPALYDLKTERMANRAAVGILKTYGASTAQRNAYRAAVRPAFSTYRNAAVADLVRARGVDTGYTAGAVDAGRRALTRGAPLADVERAGEKARKRLLPDYAAAKKAVSVQHRDELRKYFEAAFLYRLQRLAAKITQLSRK